MSTGKRRALRPAKSDSCPPGNVAKHTGYRPTEADVAAAKEVLRKRNEQPALPAVKSGEGTKLVYDHPDQAIATCLAAVAIGCGDTRLSNGFIRQLADVATRAWMARQSGMNFALAVVQGIDPKDTVEALLAAQMAVVHSATMDAAANLAQAKYVEHREFCPAGGQQAGPDVRGTGRGPQEASQCRRADDQSRARDSERRWSGHCRGCSSARGRGDAKIESQPHELGARQATSDAHAPGPALLCHVEANKQAVPSAGSKMSGNVNFAVAVIQGIEPKDTVEALLATQMAVVHSAIMDAAANLAQAKYIGHRNSALLGVDKLARTFASQVEALKKHRSAGEQTIKVEHVTVNEGGQAILGM